MELAEAYRKDPCGTLSIPYWKHRNIRIPEHMQIVHQRAFDASQYAGYRDEPYFRLSHTLKEIPVPEVPGIRIETALPEDIPCLADVINRSYTDLSVTCEQLKGYTQTEVYAPSLWIMAVNLTDAAVVGCAMADVDRELREGVVEWVQVLPGWRRRGIARLMVCELLQRMSGMADYATVSGKTRNSTCPEALYRSCGFTGSDVWHVLTQTEEK